MKFRKKPIVIEAEQFFSKRKPWPRDVENLGDGPFIQTLEGALHVSEGDWIITGVKGERYPCKPDIFEATYERADVSAIAPEGLEHTKGES